MKKLLIALVAIAFLTTAAFAGSTDTQTVYYEIDAINELVFGDDTTLTMDTATAGDEPFHDFKYPTYNITTNEAAKKLTASINATMPNRVYFRVKAEAPTGASSTGLQYMNTTAKNLVTGIETVVESGITYTLNTYAYADAGLPPDGSRVITFTLCDE
ncbi:MAG: hypothetical protein ABIH00_07795 [Armatimonadota bacterium]